MQEPRAEPHAAAVRVGLWGLFDQERLAAGLYPRVVRRELARRLPGAVIRTFAPLGERRPTRADGGEPGEPLGPFDEDRRRALAGQLDCVVVGGLDLGDLHEEAVRSAYGAAAAGLRGRGTMRFLVEGLGPDLERRCPVLWHAVGAPSDVPEDEAHVFREATRNRPLVVARDEPSRERLRAAGVGPGIEVGPDPAVLAPRAFSPVLLRRRLAWLRFMGWYPTEGAAIVVQGGAAEAAAAPEVAASASRAAEARPGTSVVILEADSGDGQFAEALARGLPGAVRLPGEVGVEDVVAAIAAAAAFVGSSLHAHLVALAYARPQVLLGAGRPELQGLAALMGEAAAMAASPEDVAAALDASEGREAARGAARSRLQAMADRHLDRIAAIARQIAEEREPSGMAVVRSPEDVPPAVRAHEVQARRLALARASLADREAERRLRFVAPALHAEWRMRRVLGLPYRVVRRWMGR